MSNYVLLDMNESEIEQLKTDLEIDRFQSTLDKTTATNEAITSTVFILQKAMSYLMKDNDFHFAYSALGKHIDIFKDFVQELKDKDLKIVCSFSYEDLLICADVLQIVPKSIQFCVDNEVVKTLADKFEQFKDKILARHIYDNQNIEIQKLRQIVNALRRTQTSQYLLTTFNFPIFWVLFEPAKDIIEKYVANETASNYCQTFLSYFKLMYSTFIIDYNDANEKQEKLNNLFISFLIESPNLVLILKHEELFSFFKQIIDIYKITNFFSDRTSRFHQSLTEVISFIKKIKEEASSLENTKVSYYDTIKDYVKKQLNFIMYEKSEYYHSKNNFFDAVFENFPILFWQMYNLCNKDKSIYRLFDEVLNATIQDFVKTLAKTDIPHLVSQLHEIAFEFSRYQKFKNKNNGDKFNELYFQSMKKVFIDANREIEQLHKQAQKLNSEDLRNFYYSSKLDVIPSYFLKSFEQKQENGEDFTKYFSKEDFNFIDLLSNLENLAATHKEDKNKAQKDLLNKLGLN